MQLWAAGEGLFWLDSCCCCSVGVYGGSMLFVGTREPKNIFEVNKDTKVERRMVRKNVSCIEVLYCV